MITAVTILVLLTFIVMQMVAISVTVIVRDGWSGWRNFWL